MLVYICVIPAYDARIKIEIREVKSGLRGVRVHMNTPNKAEEIRKILEQEGWDSKPQQVINLLKEKDIEVTPQQVSNQKAKRAKHGDADLRASVLKKVKALAEELGSTDVVRRALDDLDELTKPRKDRSN